MGSWGNPPFVIELSRNNIMTPGRVLPWLPLGSDRAVLISGFLRVERAVWELPRSGFVQLKVGRSRYSEYRYIFCSEARAAKTARRGSGR